MTGEQLNPTQRRRVSMSEGPVHLVREVTGSSSLPPPGKQPRTVWRVPTSGEELLRERQWKGQEGRSRRRKGAHRHLRTKRRIWLPTAKHPGRLALRPSGPVVPTAVQDRVWKWKTAAQCNVCVSAKDSQHSSPGKNCPFP